MQSRIYVFSFLDAERSFFQHHRVLLIEVYREGHKEAWNVVQPLISIDRYRSRGKTAACGWHGILSYRSAGRQREEDPDQRRRTPLCRLHFPLRVSQFHRESRVFNINIALCGRIEPLPPRSGWCVHAYVQEFDPRYMFTKERERESQASSRQRWYCAGAAGLYLCNVRPSTNGRHPSGRFSSGA